MGPSQFNLPSQEGGELIARAIEEGITFFDTAQTYKTYEHLRAGLTIAGDKGKSVAIATKSAASEYEPMKEAVEEARKALGRDVIDVFHLHAARVGPEVFTERAGALECLVDMKAKGIIRAVGVATHSVTVARAVRERPEIDVLFPIINIRGLGILHGTRDEMAFAIARAAHTGKGVYTMKALGGGNLLSDREGAFSYVRDLPGVTSVAVGMVYPEELEMNLALFRGHPVSEELMAKTLRPKRLTIQAFCIGCGTCVDICPNYAMEIVDGKARNNKDACILCGYCAPVCPMFAIRIV